MTNARYTYCPSEDEEIVTYEDGWGYSKLDGDEAVDRFIEKRRLEFHEEWFRYTKESGVYE